MAQSTSGEGIENPEAAVPVDAVASVTSSSRQGGRRSSREKKSHQGLMLERDQGGECSGIIYRHAGV